LKYLENCLEYKNKILKENSSFVSKSALMSLINYYYLLLALYSLNLIRTSKVAAFKESNHQQQQQPIEEFSDEHLNSKRSLFGQVIFYDRRPKMTLEQLKRMYELIAEMARKEREMKLQQERREKIYREELAQRDQQSSFHRDFHTWRY